MTKIIGISGSLRKASINTALVRAIAELAPDGTDVDVATIHGIPLYDGDVEKSDGIPDAVTALKQRVLAADGIIIASPEYNHSIPGPLKNAIDWMSRAVKDQTSVFKGKPVSIVGTSPGRFGTAMANTAWLPVLRGLGTAPWFEKSLMLGGGFKLFEDGKLTDEATRERVTAYIAAYATHLGS
jgi:chromate reductase